ncbi:NAD-dependent epimerase/dehydratase family protein [Candidatus Peribacteria bacterium]|nr:NAD-dependent epimerase/dehydratase family protein [Candidatus Peribacteria bacterium]
MKKKILVTGGLGFIGAALVKALVARGETVRVLDNSSRGSKEKLGSVADDTEIIEGDIRDPALVRSAVKGMDSVMHLAFVNGTEYFYKYPAFVLDVGVKGMVNVLDSCIQEGVKELVLASSSEVYQTPPMVPTPETVPLSVPDPKNPRYSYGGGKIISELMALNYGRAYFDRVIVFRPHNVYGPAMGFEHVIPQFVGRLQELSKKSPGASFSFPIQGSGMQTRSFIYIDDFTDGLLLAIDKGEHLGIYHIGTLEEVSIKSLAMLIAKNMNLSITVQEGPELVGGTLRRCPDITTLLALGFKPKFTLSEGLLPTIEWYAAQAIGPKQKISEPPLFFLSSLS